MKDNRELPIDRTPPHIDVDEVLGPNNERLREAFPQLRFKLPEEVVEVVQTPEPPQRRKLEDL